MTAKEEICDSMQAARSALDLRASMTGKAFKKIPTDKSVTTFSIDKSLESPKLSSKQKKRIGKAVREITDADYTCGFVFVDLRTGMGIAHDAGAEVYSASSFKAVLTYYALKKRDGKILASGDRENAESAIRYSSNSAYDSLAAANIDSRYDDWLETYDLDSDTWSPYYADVTAKSMARVWADIFQYLRTHSAGAKWFSRLLSQTNVSYIRDGLKEAGENVVVQNKAGWIAESGCSASNDCAYLCCGKRDYLMIVLTDQPSSGRAYGRISDLAAALFAARDALL